MNSKLPISCIIVNYNEGQRLAACLQSVAFCNEIILVDLGSTDHSLDIARTLNCRVFSHPKVLIGEMARAAYIQEAKYDWILCADPDEVLDELLIKDIFSFHHQYANLPETASFAFPWQFYYRGNRLNGTVWGNYQRKKSVLHHRQRVLFPNQVHTVHQRLPGYQEVVIERTGNNVIHHYWCDSFKELLNKHFRYLKLEGEARYGKGDRFTLKSQLFHTIRAFAESFYFTKGWKGGLDGWILSFFYAWYIYRCWRELKKYQSRYA